MCTEPVHLPGVSLPFSDRPMRPVLRGAKASLCESHEKGGRWTFTLPLHDPALELELPLGRPEAFLLPDVSLSFSWLSETGAAFTADRLICAGPGMEPCFRLELSAPAKFLLRRLGEGCTVSLRPHVGVAREPGSNDVHSPDALPSAPPPGPETGPTPSGSTRASCEPFTGKASQLHAEPGPGKGVLGITGEPCRNAADLGLSPPFHRDLPDIEAACALLRLFALLDTLQPARFGSPTRAHLKIFRALEKQRKIFRNLNKIRHLRLFEGPDRGAVSGYEATWPERRLLLVNGVCPKRPFPGNAPRWLLLGEGEAILDFSEDCKGLTALRYDSYGRPRSLEGGFGVPSHSFSLRPGEHIAVETA